MTREDVIYAVIVGVGVGIVFLLYAKSLRYQRSVKRAEALMPPGDEWNLGVTYAIRLVAAGWTRAHVDALIAYTGARYDINFGEPMTSGRRHVLHMLNSVGARMIPGSTVDAHLAWILALSLRPDANDGQWAERVLSTPVTDVPDPDVSEVSESPTTVEVHRRRVWEERIGAPFAPLAAAAGLSFQEALTMGQRGVTADAVDRLLMLAALRGAAVTEWPLQVQS